MTLMTKGEREQLAEAIDDVFGKGSHNDPELMNVGIEIWVDEYTHQRYLRSISREKGALYLVREEAMKKACEIIRAC